MAFGSVLRALRKQHRMTQADLARALGVAESAISMWELGRRNPDREMMEQIADYFNVDMDYLFGRSDVPNAYQFQLADRIRNALSGGIRLPDNIIPMPKMNTIPLLGTIACGEPILAEENIEEHIDIPEHIHADFALRCKGNSMIGARIHDGDIVYIRQQPTVDNGQIAAVLIGEEATLKRVYLSPGTLVLQPENSAYQPMVYTGESLSEVRILGKAVGFTSTDI